MTLYDVTEAASAWWSCVSVHQTPPKLLLTHPWCYSSLIRYLQLYPAQYKPELDQSLNHIKFLLGRHSSKISGLNIVSTTLIESL